MHDCLHQLAGNVQSSAAELLPFLYTAVEANTALLYSVDHQTICSHVRELNACAKLPAHAHTHVEPKTTPIEIASAREDAEVRVAGQQTGPDEAQSVLRIRTSGREGDDRGRYRQEMPLEERGVGTRRPLLLVGWVLSMCLLQCSFMEYKNFKVVFRRYASLYFIVGVDNSEVSIVTSRNMVVELLPVSPE